MRTLLAAAVAALSLTASPASAAHVDAVVGTMTFPCYGCGVGSGTARLTVNGVYEATATFAATIPTTTCPLRAVGDGNVTGYYNGTFHFEATADAIYLVVGGVNGGSGGGVFKTEPVLPCNGQNVPATFAATVVGP